MRMRVVAVLYFRRCFMCHHTSKPHPLAQSSWRSVIGLEIHAQINSKSKLFSGGATDFLAPINSQVALLDAAMPGTLPVLNRKCVEAAVATALALKCHINLVSKFDRKHYFYSDLPAGYQITQQRLPIAVDGHLEYVQYNLSVSKHATTRNVRIKQIQLEQDSGRSLHDEKSAVSLIDLNRAGVGLLEIITEPELDDGEDAAALVKELQQLLQIIDVCDGKMEEGSLRVDANVSLMRRDSETLGTRTEVKNLNSSRSVAKAIEYEIGRHRDILESGGVVENETLSFDVISGCTIPLRDKESKRDYRFMPEPNLPALRLYTDNTQPVGLDTSQVVNVDDIHRGLARLPSQWRHDLMQMYNLSLEQTAVITSDTRWLLYYSSMLEYVHRQGRQVDPTLTYSLFMQHTIKYTNLHKIDDISQCAVGPDRAGDLCIMLQERVISMNIADKILGLMFDGDARSGAEIVQANNWYQITDETEIRQICAACLEQSPQLVKRYVKLSEKKREKAYKALLSRVVQATEGRVFWPGASRVLREMLEELRQSGGD